MSMCLEENTLVAGVGGKGILAKNVKKGMELIGRGGNVTVADVTTNPADELYTFVTRSGTYHVTAEHQITLRCGVTPTVSFHKPTTKKGHWGLRVTWLNSQTGRWRVVRFPIVSFIDPQSVRADEMTLDDSDSDDSDDSSDSDDSDSTSDGSLHDFSEMSDAASTSSINARERVEVDAMEISDCPQPLSGTREQLLAFGRKFLADVPADQKVAVGELFEVSAKQLYDSMLWRCAAGDSPVVTGVRVPLPERVTIDEPAPSSSAPLPVVTVEQRHLDAFAACSQVAGSGRVLQCFTLRALGAGRYRQAAVGDSVAVVYQLHCPLLAEEGTQSLNSSGRKSFTFLRMDQAHESLKVDVASARLVITELNPVCHDPDSRDPPETLTKAYDAVCMSSIDTVRRLLGKGRVLAFGSYCRQRWLQFAEQSGVSYEKRDVQQAGQRVPTLRFADGIEVVFAPHPSCWNPAFMVLILAAVSYVHGCPDAVTMRALSECGVRSFERDPILDIRKRTATEEGVMAFNTINIEIEGEQWADKRYALIGGMLTHNCLLWSDGAYFVPAFKAHGVTCRTNTPSNTAMRGPGAFKSIWQMESVMERIAFELNMAPDAVRAVNFYTENQLTPYGQPVTNITMQKVWAQLQAQSNYAAQKAAVAAFNAKNKWRKQGVHMTAVKYGITDPGNQVGILINVMQDDGTIIVTHTGVELGQGINSKVAQTIAYALGLPDVSLIIIDDNATNIVANGSQTGGSATSESACAAALLACTDLNNRLAPVKKANPGVTWQALIPLAAAALVNLTVNAQYNLAPPSLPFTYFVWAAACSLVELDVLTGEVQVLQADIVYDAGDALNPAVDIGQIEGAFITGLGHYLTEDVVYDAKSARLLTRGTWVSQQARNESAT
jgi:hypothetical protein